MHVAVVANGELPASSTTEVKDVLIAADLVVAADGGLAHCHAVGVWPAVVVGDLDSASEELVAEARAHGARIVEHPAEKDATDLELALHEAIALGATNVIVIAAFGGRLDHELATIALIAGSAFSGLKVSAIDGRRSMWVVRDELSLSLAPGTTLSLMPWAGAATGVGITGVKWPLNDATIGLGSTLGVSNVADETDQHISIATGTLLAIVDSA